MQGWFTAGYSNVNNFLVLFMNVLFVYAFFLRFACEIRQLVECLAFFCWSFQVLFKCLIALALPALIPSL